MTDSKPRQLAAACWIALSLALALPAAPAAAQTDAAVTEAAANPVERRAEIARQLEAGSPHADLLQAEDRLLVQQLAAIERKSLIEEALASAEAARVSAAELVGATSPPRLQDLDRGIDLELAAASELQRWQSAIASAERSLAEARGRVDSSARALRLAKDRRGDTAEAAEIVARAEATVSLAEADLALRELALENARREVDLRSMRLAQAREVVEELDKELALSPTDLEQAVANLDAERFELQRSAEAARLRLREADGLWEAAQRRVDASLDGGAETQQMLQEMLKARRLAVQAEERQAALIDRQIERLDHAIQDARDRYQLLSGDLTQDTVEELEHRVGERISRLQREARNQTGRVADLAAEVQRVETEIAAGGFGPQRRLWLAAQQESLTAVIAANEADLAQVNRLVAPLARIQLQLTDRRAKLPAAPPATTLDRFSKGWEQVRRIWTYELTVVQDSPITVGKLILAFLLLTLGFMISRGLSRALGKRVLPRFGLATGAATALQTLSFYLILVVVVIWALHLLHIPLTALTVLGGAVAIGVGFGSQNVINNFISGLILLIERPIEVGDIVDLEGVFGTVEQIGPRSCRIRSGDNIHIIVPNSRFLEENVVNWTLSDDVVRATVDVGVAYGSPTRKVEELTMKALEDEILVLDSPPPEVIFLEFGDNALIFRGLFWVRTAGPMDRRRVESKVRFLIDELFAEAGIVIAFPQRDVHLDTLSPLEVRVLSKPTEDE